MGTNGIWPKCWCRDDKSVLPSCYWAWPPIYSAHRFGSTALAPGFERLVLANLQACGTESRAGTPLSLPVASGRPFARSGRAIRAAAHLVFETVLSWGGPSPRPVVGPQVCSICVVTGPTRIALARHASALPENSLLPCSRPQALPLCRRWCPTVANGSPDLPDPAWAGAEPMDGVTGRRHSPPGPGPSPSSCRGALSRCPTHARRR